MPGGCRRVWCGPVYHHWYGRWLCEASPRGLAPWLSPWLWWPSYPELCVPDQVPDTPAEKVRAVDHAWPRSACWATTLHVEVCSLLWRGRRPVLLVTQCRSLIGGRTLPRWSFEHGVRYRILATSKSTQDWCRKSVFTNIQNFSDPSSRERKKRERTTC